MTRPRLSAFTLIELLIVVAIIAILAAIAVPNFLEAQTRSKVSRTAADMRSIDTAIQAYIVDWNNEPKVDMTAGTGEYSSWWGFVSINITTPVAYITARPVMPFTDKTINAFWRGLGGTLGNQTYTMIRDTSVSVWAVGYTAPAPAGGQTYPVPDLWRQKQDKAGYVIYNGGPDGADMTVWGSPAFYDPTNGTVSYGDIYRFAAAGDINDNDRTH